MGYPYMELCYKKTLFIRAICSHARCSYYEAKQHCQHQQIAQRSWPVESQNCHPDSKISFQIQGAKVGKTIKLLSHGGVIWSSNFPIRALQLPHLGWISTKSHDVLLHPLQCHALILDLAKSFFKHVGIWKVNMSFLYFSANWQKSWKKLDYFFIQRIHESEMIGKLEHFGRLLYFNASKTNTSCVECLQTIVPSRVQSVQRS